MLRVGNITMTRCWTVVAAVVLSVLLIAWPSPSFAQPTCRFVLGFADLAARLGPSVAGACLENQRTITGPEDFNLSTVSLTLPSGSTVQRTTTGVFSWSPETNNTFFRDALGATRVDL